MNAGFRVSLLKGKIVKVFHSDEQAVKFTTTIMKRFVHKTGASAAIKFKRADGIKTYLMYSNGDRPFEMSEFDYVRFYSGFFSKSQLRSIIDTHDINYNSIARVASSGSTKTSMLNLFRFAMGLFLYLVFGSLILYFLQNPSNEMKASMAVSGLAINNESVINCFVALLVVAYSTLSLVVIRRIYYAKLIGKRKGRTEETIINIAHKKWGKFRRITKQIDNASLVLTITQFILFIPITILLWNTVYFGNFWQSYITIIFIVLMLMRLVFVIVFMFYTIIMATKLENSLIKVYITDGKIVDYNLFLKGQKEDLKNVEAKEDHLFLRTIPKKMLPKIHDAKQKVGAEARAFRKERKKIFLENVSEFEIIEE